MAAESNEALGAFGGSAASPEAEPLVSVITPALNAERFLEEMIESVLGQSYERVELVIADGGSSDRTTEIVEGYGRRHPGRVRLLREPRGSGVWYRRNRGLLASRGSLMCSHDADDVWLPDKLERQVELMVARPEIGLVYGYFEAFDSETGAEISWSDARHDWEGDLLVPLWVKGCFIGALTAMVRRSALDERKVRLGNERFQFGDDYWVWLAVALDHPVARIDRVLARYRRHDSNASTMLGESNYPLETISLLDEFLDTFPEARERLGEWRRIGISRHYARAAAFEATRGHRLRAGLYRLRAGLLSRRGLSLTDPQLDDLMREHLAEPNGEAPGATRS